ncbi:hypothetical protein MPSEU_001031800 [Mayamaea pseudoterrestris]|nr:hypothetical protein MPSEU_001031800 [Mayamaea pseudoterrestris]
MTDAVARQCRPEPSTSKCSLTLQVLPHYADSAACLHATSSGVAAIMIRLDTFEFATNDDDEICDVNRTFVLHNYAIASLVVALANPGAITSASLLQNCLKLLLRCQQILARISGKAMLSSWDLMHKVYTLALISTSNLLLVLTRLGAGQFQLEAEELETKLESLRQILAKLDPPAMSHILAAASA